MEQELIKSPFHSSASPAIPAIVLQTGEERWDGRCLLFYNTFPLPPDFGVMRAYLFLGKGNIIFFFIAAAA